MEKALLILDLDETLLFGTKEPLEQNSDFLVGPYYIYLRPYCREFLEETCKYYKLAIWSSAGEEYVQTIASNLSTGVLQFEFVWSRLKATYRQSKFDEINYAFGNDSHQYYVKKLSKVKKLHFELERTLIVDDSPHKCVENYGNAIYPIEFTGDLNDNELKILLKYLIEIKDHNNFRTFEKRNWKQQI